MNHPSHSSTILVLVLSSLIVISSALSGVALITKPVIAQNSNLLRGGTPYNVNVSHRTAVPSSYTTTSRSFIRSQMLGQYLHDLSSASEIANSFRISSSNPLQNLIQHRLQLHNQASTTEQQQISPTHTTATQAPPNSSTNDIRPSTNQTKVMASSSIKAASTGQSQFSGTADGQLVNYSYCGNPNTGEQNVDVCRVTQTGHTDFSGTLDYNGKVRGLDQYIPTPGQPMGTCNTEQISEDLTLGTSTVFGGGQNVVYGHDPSNPSSAPVQLSGSVDVDTTQKIMGMALTTLQFLCGGLSVPGAVPYNENNGIASASGGDSLSATQTSPPGLPDGSQTASNQWSASLVLPPCDPSTQNCPPPPNQPPTANAGPDQSVNSGDAVTLDGSGSSDPDPGDSIASYQWSSSDPSITLSGVDTPNPAFTAPIVDKDTTFTIQLVVTDTHGAQSQPDTVDVLVKAPPPCPVTTTSSALKANTAAAAAAGSGQCTPPTIKVKGKIFLQTPPKDRGDIPIPSLKVQLCSAASITPTTTPDCPVTGFTDGSGNYELSTNKLSMADARLYVTFSNNDNDMLANQYPNNEAATLLISNLPFVLDPITGQYVANTDVKFSADSPYIFLNNSPGGLSVTASNVAPAYLAELAGSYYYVEKSLEFSKKVLPIALNYKMPLKVVIRFPETINPTSFDTSLTALEIEPDDSDNIVSHSQKLVEESQDIIFHEFGHFLNFEITRDAFAPDDSLNPAYVAAVPPGNPYYLKQDCHKGYAQLDSSCALDEGKATFFGALLADQVLNDPNHAYYKKLVTNLNFGGPPINIESTKSIAGDKKFNKPPFFQYNGLSEEFAIASLIWDLYDDTPQEQIGTIDGKVAFDLIHMNLNDLINSLILPKTTTEYYTDLINAKIVDKNQLDTEFAAFDICIDSNNDGKCIQSEVKGGLSAWQVRSFGSSFGYPYPGYKFPAGRP